MKLFCTLLLLMLMSCGKAPEMKMPEPREKKLFETLSQKEPEDVLSLKYNNKVQLNCSVRVSEGNKINFSDDPADTLSWDMPGDKSVMKILRFYLGTEPFVIVLKIAEPLKILEHLSYTSPDLREYFMEHTPTVKIQYRRGPTSILTSGSVHQREAFKEVSLYENIETRLEQRQSKTDDDILMAEDFRCMLTTEINKPYQHQWKIVK